ncbi:MAG: type II secretion system F family protein [Lentisphaerae bacterium]|nr:type II secretion system F family protein [Lentisphaerota bacterium]
MSLFVQKPTQPTARATPAQPSGRFSAEKKPISRKVGGHPSHWQNRVAVSGARRIVNRELAPFSRQLSAMLRAGMSLIVGLTTLEEQTTFAPFKKLLTSIRLHVEAGNTFSDSLAFYPQVFDALYVNIVRAGERSGEFAVTMRQLGDLLESTARLRRKVKAAMTYPIVVLCVALIIAIGLITFVVPVFGGMFAEFGAQLPGPTQFLLDTSAFFRKRGLWLIGAIGVAAFFFVRWKRTETGTRRIDSILLRLPVFGLLTQKTCIARVSRILALMMKSGVPILDALSIVARTSGNMIISEAIFEARATVEQGSPLAQGLEGKACIPTLMVRMLAAGEKTGQIDSMCVNIADTYDDEVETMISALTSLLEPLLMVFLGILIGGIVISLFLPIFKLASIVGG